MADTTAQESPASAGPALGSTADQVPYVPVSWLAVAAAASAGILAILLLILGFVHFRAKRPLLEEQLLIFAILSIVLSFAARRVIRNSEGTRTGMLFGVDLSNAAWWGGLVLGLGYISYLLAIEFSIRRDAQSEVQVWTDQVLKGDAESLNRAFHRTQDPSQRRNISPTNGELLEARWGREYTAFKQCDLRRLLMRNEGESRIEIGGLREWRYQPTGIDCVYTATLTCPEGTFPLLFPMKGVEGSAAGTDSGGRQWQILLSPSAGYIDKEKAKLTPYGWMIAQLGITGAEFSRQVMQSASTTRESRAALYPGFASNDPQTQDFYRPLTVGGAQARAALTGTFSAYIFSPGKEFMDYSADRLFKLPGGEKADESRMKLFKEAWFNTGIVRAGERIRESMDINDQIIVTDTEVLYRLPIEVPLTSTRGDIIAARGGLVLKCTDPQILVELKKLKASADPATGTETPEGGISVRAIPWKIERIESDMKPIKSEPPKQPGPPKM